MFASITKSIKSLAKGPRAILAENIALVLSQHFVLDPKDIESSLLKDARIVLKNTKLREKQYKSQDLPNVVVSIKGVVEEVVFSWRWSLPGASSAQNASNGYSSGSGMVQDVMLSIKGLKVSIGLHAWDTLQESEKDLIEEFGNASISTSTLTQDDGSTISASTGNSSSSSSSSSGVSDSEKEGFIQTYVQQIVDHLTLKIEDFEVEIQVGKGGPCIIIAGNDLELGTLSAAKLKDTSIANVSTQLSQMLSVRMFSVNAKDGRSEKVCPLIEPFGYTASVLRTSGVRFQGGIMSGLHVIGLPEEHFDSSGEGILFHAGREQLSVLSAFGMMFAPSGPPEDTLSTPLSEENTNTALQSIGPKQNFNEDCNSTLFELPLPALTFVLPRSQANETSSKITLPSTTVSYRADGKVFNMKGICGVKENGNPLIGFGHGGQWRIDFVERNLHIEDAKSSENGGPTIGICGEALMRISSDITCLLSGDDIVKLQNAWDVEKPSAATITKRDPTAQPWTVSNGEYLKIVFNDRDTKILVKNIVVGGDFDSINVDSIKCKGPNETSCTLKHIALKTINSGFYVQVGEIETICLPTIARLSEPIKNASFAYLGDHINLQLESAKVVMLQNILAGNNSSSDGIDDAAQPSTDINIAIPFGIRTQIKTLHVKLSPEDDAYIQIAGLKANLVPDDNDGTINIDTLEKVHIRVDRGSQWLQCSLEPSFVAVPKTLTTITAMQCGGISLSSPTLGLPQVELPPCSILPDSNNAVMEGPLCVKIKSFDAMEKIQNFLSFPSQKAASKATEEKPSANILPVSLSIPKVELCVQEPKIQLYGTSISLQGLLLKCDSFDGQDANGIIASMQGLECNLISEVSLNIQSLSKLLIPEIFKLEAPIHDTSIIYKNGRILIDLNTVHGTLASLQSQTNNPPSSDSTVSIPFPLNLNVKSLALKDHTNHCVVSIKNVGVSVAQIESHYSLRTRGNMLVRVKSILSGEWAQASVGELSLLAVQINDSFKTKKIDFSGGTIGPCSPSLGQLSIVIPRVQQNGLNTACSMQSAITVSLGSLETIKKLSALVPQSSESSFEGLTFPVFVPEIKILISELSARIHLQSVSACGSIVTITDARGKIEGLATTSIKGLKVDVRANYLEIASVESLSMRNANLSKQLLDLSLRFENGVLKINLPSTIHVNILSETRGDAQSAAVSQQSEIVIPFPISMGITQANFKIFTSDKESLLIVKEVVANILPQNMPGQPLLEDPFTKNGAKISLLSSMEHELFRARNVNISFLVGFNDFSTVRNLHASVESATVTAGFSSIDWNTLFNSSEENTNLNIISTPFANFSQFKLSISYQGKALATKAHIDVPSFVGNGSTTSDDLKSHYTKVVMNRIPGFLTNVEFLGNNVVDSTFANVGRVAIGKKSLAGGVGGSIVGTVAVDGIRSAISAGKSARNAASNEGYKFGDVTRGITRGLSQARQVGAQSRGSDGRDYIPGDLAVGVATTGGEYVVNNKGKLASVGGSSVGSMVGLAVAGPIGFLAGSYLGGKAGKTAVGEDAQGMLQFKYLSLFILALAMNLSNNVIRRDIYKTEYYWKSSAARLYHRFPAHANSTNPESQFKIAISDNSLSAAVKSNES